jgi:ankyrin repeat protein
MENFIYISSDNNLNERINNIENFLRNNNLGYDTFLKYQGPYTKDNIDDILDDWTPLTYNSYHGYLSSVKKLVNMGADVNKQYNNQFPLLCAAKNNQYQIFNYLVENGANILDVYDYFPYEDNEINKIISTNLINNIIKDNINDQIYQKLLIFFIKNNDFDNIKKLVEMGINLKKLDLTHTFKKDNQIALGIYKYLLNHGAAGQTYINSNEIRIHFINFE